MRSEIQRKQFERKPFVCGVNATCQFEIKTEIALSMSFKTLTAAGKSKRIASVVSERESVPRFCSKTLVKPNGFPVCQSSKPKNQQQTVQRPFKQVGRSYGALSLFGGHFKKIRTRNVKQQMKNLTKNLSKKSLVISCNFLTSVCSSNLVVWLEVYLGASTWTTSSMRWTACMQRSASRPCKVQCRSRS